MDWQVIYPYYEFLCCLGQFPPQYVTAVMTGNGIAGVSSILLQYVRYSRSMLA